MYLCRKKKENVSLQGQMRDLINWSALNNLFLSLSGMDAHSMSKHWQLLDWRLNPYPLPWKRGS